MIAPFMTRASSVASGSVETVTRHVVGDHAYVYTCRWKDAKKNGQPALSPLTQIKWWTTIMSSTFAESIATVVLESRNNSFYRCKNFRFYKIPRSTIQLCYSFLVENLNNSINSIKTFSSGELIAEQAFKKFPRTAAMQYPDSCLRKRKSQ